MDKKFYDALASSIYMNSMALAGKSITTDDQKLRASGLYADWKPGSHTTGEIYNAAEQTWECYQDYDNAVYPDIAPGNSAWFTFNRPLHGKSKATARPWVRPAHSMDIYRYGEYMIYTDGGTYRCTAANGTNFSPEEYSAGWEVTD